MLLPPVKVSIKKLLSVMALALLWAASAGAADPLPDASESATQTPGIASLRETLLAFGDDKSAAAVWPLGSHALNGQVVDATGRPVAGASIWVAFVETGNRSPWSNGPTPPVVVADQQGRFEVRDLDAGLWAIGAADGSSTYGFADNRVPGDPPARVVVEPAQASITGTVVDSVTGEPVAGATLRARLQGTPTGKKSALAMIGANKAETTSDAEGRFTFGNLLSDSWSITGVHGAVWLRDQKTKQQWAVVDVGQVPGEANVQLESYPGWTVTGKVVEHKTGTPLEGVVVGILRPGDHPRNEATTDAEGRYRLAHVYPGGAFVPHGTSMVNLSLKNTGYQMRIRKPETTLMGSSASLSPMPLVELPVDAREVVVDFEMKPTVTVSGVVVDPAGNPVPHAELKMKAIQQAGASVASRNITADESGRFETTVLRDTEVELTSRVLDVGYGRLGPISVTNQPVEGLRLIVEPGVSLAGVVRDTSGGVPTRIHEVIAELIDEKHRRETVGRAETKPDGSFRVTNLPPGKLSLHLDGDRYRGLGEPSAAPVTLLPGQSHGGMVIEIPVAQSFGGILRYTDGSPLADARIDLRVTYDYTATTSWEMDNPTETSGSTSCRVVSDSQGRFRYEPIFGRVTSMDVWWGKNRKTSWGADNKKGSTLKLNDPDIVYTVQLDEPITVQIAVVDANTLAPIPTARLCGEIGQWTVAEVDPNNPGTFVVRDVSANSYDFSLCLEAEGYAPELVTRSNLQLPTKLAAGSVVERQVMLYPPTPLTGRVVEKGTSKPIEGLAVMLSTAQEARSGQNLAVTTTDADGRFSFLVGSASDLNVRVSVARPDGKMAPAAPMMGMVIPVNTAVSVSRGTPKDMGDIEFGKPPRK